MAQTKVQLLSAIDVPGYTNYSGNPSATWSAGTLLYIDQDFTASPVIRVFGRTGVEVTELPVVIAGATIVSVWQASRSNDGLTAACGTAIDSKGRSSSFLVIFNAASQAATVVVTRSFHPLQVAVGRDDTVWAQGYTLGQAAASANTIWRFSASGSVIGSFLSQSSFSFASTDELLAALLDPHNKLAVNTTGLVWLCPKRTFYIALDNAGATVRSNSSVALRAGDEVSGIALMSDGRVFIGTQSATPPPQNLYSLNETTGGLTSVLVPKQLRLLGEDNGGLVGWDGKHLVFLSIN